MAIMTIPTVEDLLATLSMGHGRLLRPDASIDLLDHALQSASEAYALRPADDELHVAALVHDVGRLLPGNAPAAAVDHAWLGAAAVRRLLGRRVADLVAGHELTKRYRVTVALDAGGEVPDHQLARIQAYGGPLAPSQRRKFERQRNLNDALTLDDADEAADQAGRVAPSLLSWKPVLDAVADATRREREIAVRSLETTLVF